MSCWSFVSSTQGNASVWIGVGVIGLDREMLF